MERVFELEDESKMILKIKGGEYRIDPPPSIQLASYLNAADKYAKGDLGAGEFFIEVNKHLFNLGVPKDVVKDLTANQQAKLLEFVYQGDQKKS